MLGLQAKAPQVYKSAGSKQGEMSRDTEYITRPMEAPLKTEVSDVWKSMIPHCVGST